jgi:hypothetical protein
MHSKSPTALSLARIILFVAAGLVLLACRDGGVSRSIVSVRWIVPDTLLAYAVYETEETVETGSFPFGPDKPKPLWSSIRIYRMKVAGTCQERALIHEIEGAVSCHTFAYRPQDSILAFGYLPYTVKNFKKAGRCGTEDAVVFGVGKIRAGAWTSTTPPSADTLRASLIAAGNPDLPLSQYAALCPPGCSCINGDTDADAD